MVSEIALMHVKNLGRILPSVYIVLRSDGGGRDPKSGRRKKEPDTKKKEHLKPTAPKIMGNPPQTISVDAAWTRRLQGSRKKNAEKKKDLRAW